MKTCNWITEGMKKSCKNKTSLFAYTKYSDEPKILAHDIKYCIMQRNIVHEANKQHYSRL
jgi:hypothetical protein